MVVEELLSMGYDYAPGVYILIAQWRGWKLRN